MKKTIFCSLLIASLASSSLKAEDAPKPPHEVGQPSNARQKAQKARQRNNIILAAVASAAAIVVVVLVSNNQ